MKLSSQNHCEKDPIRVIVQKRPTKKVVIEWYDGGIKVLLYFEEVSSWFYFSLVGIDHESAQRAFSYTIINSQQLLNSVISMSESGGVCLNKEFTHEELLVKLDSYLRDCLNSNIVISSEILNGFNELKILKSSPKVLDWEEIFASSEDLNGVFLS
ncbi:hypothetical protein [Pseudoalteromonas carrageenovora]|uniref:hypothetical protein n=1 Tax=Pseudoalteromonas carrageenovora TaxID=227 RepID=UPI0026E2F960|nr:hypothetical protein [Pseudoalteromonas carrageenovora]MDO6464457.1 hypothetical protein [Pseudoalteromonas carrageenovora]